WTSSWRRKVDWSAGMRSSESVDCLALLAPRFFIAGSLLLAACSTPPVASQTTSTARAPAECVIAGPGVSPQEAEMVAALRATVEKGPLYAILNTAAGVASCRIGTDSS